LPIPPEIRERFFQKYSTVGKKGGTGLGAYSARLMAVTQDGSIRVESSEQSGTTVIVDLPRATAETQRAQANQVAASTWLLATADWPRRSILVVDDDANNRAILRHFLAHPRWTVEEAENGPLALEIFRNGAFDFVLCDIEMPVMDGFEVVAQMRRMEASERRAQATVVALSSHDDAAITERALKSGFDQYLTKPVNRRTLLEAIVGPAAIRTVTVDADVKHLIPTFLEKKKEELQTAAAMVAGQDHEGAQHEFHRLRGSFNMYGFSAAGALCAEMEELARTRQLARISEPLASLSDYLNQVDVHYSDEKAEAETQ
jgi:CheY-like chemotaxis protein